MHRDHERISVGRAFVLPLVLLTAIALEQGLTSDSMYYFLLFFTIPMLLILLIAFRSKRSGNQG